MYISFKCILIVDKKKSIQSFFNVFIILAADVALLLRS